MALSSHQLHPENLHQNEAPLLYPTPKIFWLTDFVEDYFEESHLASLPPAKPDPLASLRGDAPKERVPVNYRQKFASQLLKKFHAAIDAKGRADDKYHAAKEFLDTLEEDMTNLAAFLAKDASVEAIGKRFDGNTKESQLLRLELQNLIRTFRSADDNSLTSVMQDTCRHWDVEAGKVEDNKREIDRVTESADFLKNGGLQRVFKTHPQFGQEVAVYFTYLRRRRLDAEHDATAGIRRSPEEVLQREYARRAKHDELSNKLSKYSGLDMPLNIGRDAISDLVKANENLLDSKGDGVIRYDQNNGTFVLRDL